MCLSAPCDPQNITSVLQCDTNVATVTWNASIGAYGYTVMAYAAGQQQSVASCGTNGTSCQLISLPCGMRLNVTVQTQDPTCNSTAPTTDAAIITTGVRLHVNKNKYIQVCYQYTYFNLIKNESILSLYLLCTLLLHLKNVT